MTQKNSIKSRIIQYPPIIIRLFTLTTLYNRVASRAKEERGARDRKAKKSSLLFLCYLSRIFHRGKDGEEKPQAGGFPAILSPLLGLLSGVAPILSVVGRLLTPTSALSSSA
ncbi:unnamed protein product [Brassica napus]|uniref:(rape) hypothetical protein n=1 Tax=Brassica napus TaxID=3708 RepID=A0A816T7N3_BRANA|nr:unnamed protein product [Brassica napus]